MKNMKTAHKACQRNLLAQKILKNAIEKIKEENRK